ncbi:MAG: redoxin domain-containing protein [Planctomycetes bacterium]|nr:redoxin domain-containing protein [Planctomycetota bacterium]
MSRTILCSFILLLLFAVPGVSQDPPKVPDAPKAYATYAELFDAFDAKRQVLLTRMDRLREKETVKPDEMQAVEDELRELDGSYADALDVYIQGHPKADDLMPARFELAVALSRNEGKLEQAVTAADDFLANHADSELVADVRFIKAQTLFRLPGKEKLALAALDEFIDKHGDRQEADACRMMRVRLLLFMDKVADAKNSLDALIKSERAKDDPQAKEFLQVQRNNLDWVDRKLPDFSLSDLKGTLRKADDYEGKPTLLLIWDTNSGACLGELPYVQDAYKQFSDKMNFLSISVNEAKPALEQWLDRNAEAVKFPTVWIDRDEENSLVKKLDVSLIPFLVLVGSNGKIFRYDVRSDDMLRYAAILTGE